MENSYDCLLENDILFYFEEDYLAFPSFICNPVVSRDGGIFYFVSLSVFFIIFSDIYCFDQPITLTKLDL